MDFNSYLLFMDILWVFYLLSIASRVGFDFSFDDAIADRYGCKVEAFDPTLVVKFVKIRMKCALI